MECLICQIGNSPLDTITTPSQLHFPRWHPYYVRLLRCNNPICDARALSQRPSGCIFSRRHPHYSQAPLTKKPFEFRTVVPIVKLQGHPAYVQTVAFSPDGTRVISGSDDMTVRIWYALSGAPIGEPLQGHSGNVYSVAFSPDGVCVISGSNDRTVQVWDAIPGVPLGMPLHWRCHVGHIFS